MHYVKSVIFYLVAIAYCSGIAQSSTEDTSDKLLGCDVAIMKSTMREIVERYFPDYHHTLSYPVVAKINVIDPHGIDVYAVPPENQIGGFVNVAFESSKCSVVHIYIAQ